MTINTALFTSNKDDWETPQSFFDQLNSKYHFSIDLAASDSNHKCARYFTEKDDALQQDWSTMGGQCGLIRHMVVISRIGLKRRMKIH